MNNIFSSVLLTTTEGQSGGILSLLSFPLLIVVMFVVMYFFAIRPQKKKEKAVKAMLDALKVGDRVLTIGGIYGTVTGVKDDQVIIAVGAQKTVMNMARWAIKSVEDAPLESDKTPEI